MSSICVITGRIGQDAKVARSDNGRTAFRFSMATSKRLGGQDVTTWHPVSYFCGAEAEIQYLTERLVKGALVVVTGEVANYRRAHDEYPIEITHYAVEASRVEVLVPPNKATDSGAVKTPVTAIPSSSAPVAAEAAGREQTQPGGGVIFF